MASWFGRFVLKHTKTTLEKFKNEFLVYSTTDITNVKEGLMKQIRLEL